MAVIRGYRWVTGGSDGGVATMIRVGRFGEPLLRLWPGEKTLWAAQGWSQTPELPTTPREAIMMSPLTLEDYKDTECSYHWSQKLETKNRKSRKFQRIKMI